MILLYYIWKPAPILDKDLWPTVGHLVHNCHTREITVNIFPTELLVYRSAIYPQWKTFKYCLGGRLHLSVCSPVRIFLKIEQDR